MKKLSESIWSDMQDRSAGDVVRQEDIKDTYYMNVIKHYTSMESMYYGNKLCVRLVKDK